MADPKELDALIPGEAKRQREALRRKLDRPGPMTVELVFVTNKRVGTHDP